MNIILIPAYEPDGALVVFVNHLIKLTSTPILVINDGSDHNYDSIFETVHQLGCYVIKHDVNKGKGAAIKSGISMANQMYSTVSNYITCDADGQHLPEDVYKMLVASEENKNELILGVRNFKGNNVPFKSKIGNYFSSLYFYLSTRMHCPDTQTGLRSIPFSLSSDALSLKEDHYDFEMSFLLKQAKARFPIRYLPIKTVYLNHNQKSHFKPVKDSVLIYRQPLRFALASISSAVIDLGLFSILLYTLSNSIIERVVIASVIARVFSGIYNFLMNRAWSFKSKNNIKKQFVKYGILYLGQLSTSILVVSLLVDFTNHLTLGKFFVDSTLFIMSYFIQKNWVFAHKK